MTQNPTPALDTAAADVAASQRATAAGTDHVWQTATVPSKGRYYGNLMPNGEVQVRKWTAREVELLTSQGMSGTERITRIINACMKLPSGLKPEELLVPDRFALLLDQRIVSYGPDLQFTYKDSRGVPRKERFNLHNLKCYSPEDRLAELEEKRLDAQERGDLERAERYVWDGNEPYPVRLPEKGDVVMCRFPRQSDADYVQKASRARENQTGDGRSIASTLLAMRRIVSIEGRDEMKPNVLEQYVKQLSIKDINHIRQAADARESGYDLTIMVPDGQGGEMEMALPIDDGFFLDNDY